LTARVAAAAGRVALTETQARLIRLQILQETAVAWIAREAIERQLTLIIELEDENRLFDRAVRAQFAGGGGVASELLAPRRKPR